MGDVPITWIFSTSDRTSTGKAWASIKPSGGDTHTIGAGAHQVLVVTPNADVCLTRGTTTYHATLTATSPGGMRTYGSVSIADTITVSDE